MFVFLHTRILKGSLPEVVCEDGESHVRPYKEMDGVGGVLGGDCLTSRHVTL